MQRPPTYVPSIEPSCNVTRLPIGAVEGFVLSRIDGSTTCGDLLAITGLPVEQFDQILERLEQLGAIHIAPSSLPAPPRKPTPAPIPVASPAAPPRVISLTNVPAMIAPKPWQTSVPPRAASISSSGRIPLDAIRNGTLDSPLPPAVHSSAPVPSKELQAQAIALMHVGRSAEMLESWSEAAIAYLKAHELVPRDATICDRASNALRKVGTDVRRSVKLAEEAVQINPKKVQYRITLALAYMEAKLMRRAQAELEQANKLSPDDVRVRKLLQQVRRA
ncbi:MAG: hypothetical protein NVSMB1_23750 [Polyangiales bacterium]